MERASIPSSGALEEPAEQATEQPEPPEQAALPRWETIKRRAAQLSVMAVCAAATVAGVISGNESSGYRAPAPPAATPKPQPHGPHYRPIANLESVRGGNGLVGKVASTELDQNGQAVGIMEPDGSTSRSYNVYFNTPWVGVQHPPHLRETIHMLDGSTFSGIGEQHPHRYPFDIYDATDDPVDITFASYAIRSTNFWLQMSRGGNNADINIGGHTLAKVEPISDPHIMIMVDKIPANAKSNIFSATDGVTYRTPGSITRSFIKNSGSVQEPFRREAVATEICQSMVNVTDERLIPGMILHQNDMKQYAGSFNRPALKNLDLASQESVCNGLGNYLTAAYEKGHGLRQIVIRHKLLPATPFTEGLSTETDWIDYGLYRPAREQILLLGQQATGGENSPVVFERGADTPTAAFYQEHQPDGPYQLATK